MKKITILTLLLFSLFITSSCEKEKQNEPNEQDEQIQPIGNYTENEALVNAVSTVYFICDVEGLDGVQKINMQNISISSNVSSSWGKFICDPGYDGFTSSCSQTLNQQTNFHLKFHFMGKCPSCKWEDIVKIGNHDLASSDTRYIGTAIWLHVYNFSETYKSDSELKPAEHAKDEIKVISIEPDAGKSPVYYVTVHFTCTLKSASGKVIHLKNAVARMKTDDMI